VTDGRTLGVSFHEGAYEHQAAWGTLYRSCRQRPAWKVAMSLHIIRTTAKPTEVVEMLECHGDFIKLAVDVERKVIAGGGEYHADCEEALIEDGSRQDNVWGADWYPDTGSIEFNAIINIRPGQGNRSLEIASAELRGRIELVVRERLT